MKIINKLICAAASAALCLSMYLPSAAESRRWVLYSDIKAYISGSLIQSYNIDGDTYIRAEDLVDYGFEVIWNGDERTLDIYRAVDDSGNEMIEPDVPEYTVESALRKPGDRYKTVVDTDIVTGVCGSRVEGLNLEGETIIQFDELADFGKVIWDGDSRSISLEFGNAADIAVSSMIRDIESWAESGGKGSYYKLYENDFGTLIFTHVTGTPHGSASSMSFFKRSGKRLDIEELLPQVHHGASAYLRPTEIGFSDGGRVLSFVTPIYEDIGDERVFHGDNFCEIDLIDGILLGMTPVLKN